MTDLPSRETDQYTILHLSDIHLKLEHKKYLPLLAEKISNALTSKIDLSEKIIFVISGDLAFSGQVDQYDLFKTFLGLMEAKINSSGKSLGYEYIFVPGNHDCDFSKPSPVRNALLSSADVFNPEIIKNIAHVQENYVKFYKEATGRSLNIGEIYKSVIIDEAINFIEINTSWTSQLHETQAEIRMPTTDNKIFDGGRISICVQHHPYNWIKSEDAHNLRDGILNQCQMSLSGHEHSAERLHTYSRDENGVLFLEAGAIIDGSLSAKFNVIKLNISANAVAVYGFIYKLGEDFSEIQDSGEYKGLIKEIKHPRSLQFAQIYLTEINKIDSIIGSNNDLKLMDVYVYPNLDDLSLTASEAKTVVSSKVFEVLRTDKRAIIYGQPSSGKTSLSRRLSFDTQKLGLSPIFISGRSLKSLKEIKSRFTNSLDLMYERISWEKYAQIPIAERVLIIDEAQDILHNHNSSPEILDYINANFGNVYLIAGSDPLEGILSEISARYDSTFSRYRIEEYRAGLRRTIIERYASCLNLDPKQDNEYLQRLSEAESSIEAALRSKLISSYPLYIIGVLQHYGRASGRTIAGSNNFVYDLLIKINLSRISTQDDDLSVYESFLGDLAFHLFDSKEEEITYDDFEIFIDKYYNIKKINSVISKSKIVNDLVGASILDRSDGTIKFRHYHHLYYFLANHLKNNYKKSSTTDILDMMISDLSSPLNINTIMFTIFLTKDFDIVEKIMRTLDHSIDGLPEIDIVAFSKEMKKNNDLAKKVIDEMRQDSLPSTDPKDEEGNLIDNSSEESADLLDEDEIKITALQNILQILRVTDLLGQIVKNHVGTWDGEQKSRIIELCYRTSRKVTFALLSEIDDLARNIALGESEKFKIDNKLSEISTLNSSQNRALVNAVQRSVFNLMEFAVVGMVSRVTRAIGTSKLREIYRDIPNSNSDPNIALIDMNLDMYFSNDFPKMKVTKLYGKYEDDFLISRVIRHLVYLNMNYYYVKEQVRSEVTTKLGMNSANKKLLVSYRGGSKR